MMSFVVLLTVVDNGFARAESERISVLFLGDRGHHSPSDRADQWIPVMDRAGIDVTYTDDLNSLVPANLANYDAVLVYANIDELDDQRAAALLEYVAAGGGYVPVHCASFCFRNQPKLVELCGGQFLKHGTGDFSTRIEAADHPITDGIKPFTTWDETYEHHLHNDQDRTVLQTRAEGGRAEPWTWIRTHEKGRVFYTAYGHDHRTWENPGFHALLERGIRWAAGKDEVFDNSAKPSTEPANFEYSQDSGKGLPNYRHSGGSSDAIRKIQKPLDANAAVKRLAMPKGFRAEVFVSEPEIGKPLCVTWDDRGRLWVAETVDYPNDLQPRGEGRDRIKICEDTDGDGRADKFTIFAEGLSIPTGMAFASGGLVVHMAPDTVFMQDTDGDDKCDSTKVLFTGWGTFDTHAGPSNLRYGHDNWLYTIVGYSGFRGTVGGETHRFGQGIVRFKADGSKLEFIRSTNNNSWGLGFSEEGYLFGSTANGCPSVYAPIANRHYEVVRGWSSSVLRNIAPGFRFYPITEEVRQVDYFGGFTAAAGHALYTARNYPKPYWNKTAFVAEPTGHLVAIMDLVGKGTDFVANYGGNLLASDDEWCAPIAAEVGPDGNVWISDWYNIIVQHNPTPNGFETGARGAYETPLRDKSRGRIYRLVPSDAPEGGWTVPFTSADDTTKWVEGLKHTNMLWRLHAQRLLVERGKLDVVPALVALIKDRTVDEIGLNPGAIHAMRVLEGLHAKQPLPEDAITAWYSALKHPSAGVRRNAALSLPGTEATVAQILDAGLLQDAEPQVRLAANLAIVDADSQAKAGEDLANALLDKANLDDQWLRDGLVAAAARNDLSFLTACAKLQVAGELDKRVAGIIERVSEHYARGDNVKSLEVLLTSLSSTNADVTAAIISGISTGLSGDRAPKLSPELEKAIVALHDGSDPTTQSRVIVLAERWGSKTLSKQANALASKLIETIEDDSLELQERSKAVVDLAGFRRDDADVVDSLAGLLDGRTTPELIDVLVQALKGSTAEGLGPKMADALTRLTPSSRPKVLSAMLVRSEWTNDLLDCFEEGKLEITDLPLDQKQSLAAHPNKEISKRAQELLKRTGGLPNADRQSVIDQYAPLVLTGGNAQRGKAHFKTQCANCHMHSGEGKKLGPDLTGMSAHPKLELLTHILDPSRSVEGNFRTYTVLTYDGRVINGIMANETRTAIEILDAESKPYTLQRADIEQISASRKSTMPEGFEKQLDAPAMADLLEFLAARGKFFPLDLRKVATVVSTKDMFFGSDSESERLVFRNWEPKTFEGVTFHLVDPDKDRTPNVVMLYGPEGVTPPKMPKAVELPVSSPAAAIHMLSGISGWGYNGGQARKSLTMTVRLKYQDGKTEDHRLLDGIHFADYINSQIDVPESKLAFRLRGQQVRYLKVVPERKETIESIELVKGNDRTAPIVVAITVESL